MCVESFSWLPLVVVAAVVIAVTFVLRCVFTAVFRRSVFRFCLIVLFVFHIPFFSFYRATPERVLIYAQKLLLYPFEGQV